MKQEINKLLEEFSKEVTTELNAILDYWMLNTHDPVNGGFIGRVDENNVSYPAAPKGVVLNARVLWAFSASFKITGNPHHLYIARMAFKYLAENFIDKIYGGVYWTLDAKGRPLDTKKQIYALAFALYGTSTYAEINNDLEAKAVAIELYRQIEMHSFDTQYTGYYEAFTRDWQPLDDLRLSDKDANEKKTMNTHLHILEAYTALFRLWPDATLKVQIENLLKNFTEHIADEKTGHLILFFDEQWNRKSSTISFGHDIEAAWLLPEAASVIGDETIIAAINETANKLGRAAAEGLDGDGGLWYEYEKEKDHWIKEKHSWVQAEAMVGFFNQWQLTGDDSFLEKSLQAWRFIVNCIKDDKYGEWLWGINEDGSVMPGQDKVGIWKCPYHNSRACIEIFKRVRDELDVATGSVELSATI